MVTALHLPRYTWKMARSCDRHGTANTLLAAPSSRDNHCCAGWADAHGRGQPREPPSHPDAGGSRQPGWQARPAASCTGTPSLTAAAGLRQPNGQAHVPCSAGLAHDNQPLSIRHEHASHWQHNCPARSTSDAAQQPSSSRTTGPSTSHSQDITGAGRRSPSCMVPWYGALVLWLVHSIHNIWGHLMPQQPPLIYDSAHHVSDTLCTVSRIRSSLHVAGSIVS
jgi:hypothetical protein